MSSEQDEPQRFGSAARRSLAISGLLAFLAVAVGAFGAHVLEPRLPSDALETFHTGVDYHLFHALGLGLLGLVLDRLGPKAQLIWASRLMAAGVLLFSGSLYLMVLSGKAWLGAVTPFGGTAFLAAWVLFILGLLGGRTRC